MKDVRLNLFSYLSVSLLTILPVVSHAQSVGIFNEQLSVGDDLFLGEADFFDETYEILGSGSDIGGANDGFYWIYSELNSNFILTTDLEWAGQIIPGGGPSAGSANKKMGIVVREDPEDPGARNVSAVLMNASANNTNANMKWRLNPGGGTAEFSQQPKAADETDTLRLFRDGNSFIMFRGTTDGGFKRFGEITIPGMPDTVYVGLAVSANNVDALESAFFTNTTLLPLDVTVRGRRAFSQDLVSANQNVRVEVTLDVSDGDSTAVTVNEIPPSGLSISNISASVGSVSQENGMLVWDIPNASDNPSLTYNITTPGNPGTLTFRGDVNVSGTYQLSVEGKENLGVEAAVSGDRKIVYMLRDVGVNSTSDQLIVLDLQVFFGADVRDFDHNNLPGFELPDDLSEADMIYASETVQSGNIANRGYHTVFEGAMLTGEQALLDELSFGGGTGTTSGTTIEIVDNEHPITQGFDLGELQIMDTPQDIARLTNIPNGVRVLATVAGSPDQAALWVIEEGTNVNGTNSPGIRIGTWLQGRDIYATMNDDGKQLMINTFAYALGLDAPATNIEDFMLY